MRWWKRTIRIVRLGLLAVACICLLLYAAGTQGVWWNTPWRVTLWAVKGELRVDRYGPGARMAQAPARTGVGGAPVTSMGFGTSGVTVKTDAHWLWTTEVVRAAAVTFGERPPKPGSYSVSVVIRLGRVALASAIVGGLLLLVPARKHRPGACAACGYDLSGLAAGAACPECGAASAKPQSSTAESAPL